MRARRVETLALGLLLLPAFLVSQEKKPKPPAAGTPSGGEKTISFPAGVEQVIVDVVVTDKKGTPQTGLTKDDLAITEDGAAQTIVSFEAITVPAAPAANPAPRPRVSTNTSPEQQRGRTFVVVFDDIHLSPQRARPAKAAVAEFLKTGVREGDRVSLIATGGGAWWTTRMEAGRDELMALLKRLEGRYIPDTSNERVSDYEAMRIHMYNDQQVAQRVARRFETYGVTQQLQQSGNQDQGSVTGNDDPYVTARATDVYFQSAARNRISLDVLERALNALIVTKGRKSLVLVSEGFIYDPNLDEFKRVIEASRRANTAIYFLNSKGLEGMPIYMTAEFGPPLPDQDIGAAFSETFEATEGSDSLSSDSGGFVVRNTNDLSAGIKRIADENRTYYLVGYNPTNTARDGKFRKIQVKLVSKKGLQVRARKGYYAPGENPKTALTPKPGTDPVLQSALDSPYDMENIPIRMTDMVGDETLLGKAATLITVDVDLRGFAFEEKDGRFVDTLDYLLVVAHRETGEYFTVPKKVEMKLLPATRERVEKTWYTIAQDFELKPGGYQAKMVVRDTNSGRVGTVVHEFDVPDLSGFRVSTPVVSPNPQLENGKMTGQLVFQMLRDFAPAGPLFCRFEVFGAAKDPKSGMPRVTMGYQVRAADGSVFSEAPPSEIRPTSLGKLARLFGFSLDHATPGGYEIVMGFKDEVSGNTLQLKEPFNVVGSTAAAPAAAVPAPAPTPVADKPSS